MKRSISTLTAIMVSSQIEERWGWDESTKYKPGENCLTFWGWKNKGYKVKDGETGLRSYIMVKDKRKWVKKYIKVYYYLQVEKE